MPAPDGGGPETPDASSADSDAAPDWLTVPCEQNVPNALALPLALVGEPRHLGLYHSVPPGTEWYDQHAASTWRFGASGTACLHATDAAKCNARLEQLTAPSAACVERKLCEPFAIVDWPEGLVRLDERADLLRLFGAIDAPGEAAALALWDGVTAACPTSTQDAFYRGTQVEQTEAGYIVHSEYMDCGGLSRDQLELARDGATGALQSDGPECSRTSAR